MKHGKKLALRKSWAEMNMWEVYLRGSGLRTDLFKKSRI